MIEIEKFHNRAAALDALIQAKLGGRGKTLSARFRRAGRLLPKRIQRAGRVLSAAQEAAAHPKLARLVDPEYLDAAFIEVTTYFETIDPADRRKGMAVGMAAGLVFNLIVLVGAITAFLHWQDLI